MNKHGAPKKPREGRRVTIVEVAEHAGVSRSTVSRALGRNGYVAEGVRLKVQESARALGYVVNTTARSLQRSSSHTIGVLVSDLRNSFYADFASGAGGECRSRGYSMMLIDDHGVPHEERAAAESFVALRVAGVAGTPVSSQLTDFLSLQGMPVVEVDREFAEGACDAVVVDNKAAAREATAHLLELGHTRIAVLVDETDWTTGRDRVAGYIEALSVARVPFDASLVVPAGWDVKAAWSAAIRLLRGENRPTAIFTANNVLAEGVWRAASDLRLTLPRDLSLVTFDDAPWMTMVTPKVTAVIQDAQALGMMAVATLLDRIARPEAPKTRTVLPVTLELRGSTAHPAL